MIIRQLEAGPKTAGQLAGAMLADCQDLTRRNAYNRVYQSLLRLEEGGKAHRDGGLWELA